MSVEGIRVVRGPDWNYGDKDGGEGHVGTVTQDNEDDTVEVQWDMGESHTCRTGKDGKCDLRILDSGPSGLKHSGVTCDECRQQSFSGTRWKCDTCPDYDLCTPCYFKDKHKLQHPFARIDAPGLKGNIVPKRSISNKMRSLGIFEDATVIRGPDWEYGDQDGGNGKEGTVESTQNYRPDGKERNAVKVTWSNKENNKYKLGYRGKVDLICVEETPGMDYYRDHLFALSTTNVPKRRSFINEDSRLAAPPPVAPKPKPKLAEKQEALPKPTPSGPAGTLKPGDKVCVQFMEIALKDAQRGHGGWSMRMADYIGQQGVVKNIHESGDVVVQYEDKEWRFNASALRKVPSFKVGDVVRVLEEAERVQALQKRHGGWSSDMEEVLGKVGKIVIIDSDGDVAVVFGQKAVVLNPACCIPAPGCKPVQLGADAGMGSDDGYEEAGATGGAGSRPATGKQRQEGERVSDVAAETLAQMMAQLFIRGAASASVGPQQLLSAAAEGNIGQVKNILNLKPDLVNVKFRSLTALIIASHEGHESVVKLLVNSKADLNLREEKGNTALMAALMKKREAIALYLIEQGANVHLLNIFNRNALHAAVTNHVNTALRVLIEKGCNPNQVDADGNTPMHNAIQSKNNSGVAFLLAASNINLKICNSRGLSPVHLAAMKDDELSASKILAKMPDLISKSGKDGHTPLHIAALNENMDVAKLLIRLKAPIDMKNVQGLTPLHLACHQAHLQMTTVLLDNSASVTVVDNDGDTPLHVCMLGERDSDNPGDQLLGLMLGLRIRDEDEVKERFEVACLLIKNGANVNARNRRGLTPLECGSNQSLRNAVRQFVQRQASRRGQTNVGGLLGELFAAFSNICGVCGQRQAQVTFIPCGHKVCCENCSFRVRSCPLCQQMIRERIGADGKRLLLMQDPCKVQ